MFDQSAVCEFCGDAITRTSKSRAPWLAAKVDRATCYKRADGKYYHSPKDNA